MTALDQIPFSALVLPAGIVFAGLFVRQLIEILKGLGLLGVGGWIDAGNERKTSIVISGLLYLAWAASYARIFPDDAWTAVLSWIAVALASMGTNEAIDAGQAVVRGVIVPKAPGTGNEVIG